MTNEQLAVLLDQIAKRLECEIDVTRSGLPETMERRLCRNWYPFTSGWVEEPGDFVVLGGLTGVVEELRVQAESLRKAGCDECRAR